ncbi:MAG: 50S ribosomal protein L2 [Nitrososphaerota archaeon]|nr:50S ribosomal protein L2 [Nitrososphaerales archaeon]MDW8044300.1 50S ribosomal protein L2 [Nitrososphaerota archaeon]
MGRRIIQQKRGHGAPQYRVASKGKIAPVSYPSQKIGETNTAYVLDILHERGRFTPIAQLSMDDGRVVYIPAVEGLQVGAKIEIGFEASVKQGNILPLSKIPEGTVICNIEKNFGDGGKLVRAPGSSAVLFSHTPEGAIVKMPSGKSMILNENCRAMIGVIAGGGRLEKPFLKAGAKYYAVKGKGRVFPRVRAVAMAAVHHPHGGGRHAHKAPKSVSRYAPPGSKVGHIAPRRTGRRGKVKRESIST